MNNLTNNYLISTILIQYIGALESGNTESITKEIKKLTQQEKLNLANRLYDIQNCFA